MKEVAGIGERVYAMKVDKYGKKTFIGKKSFWGKLLCRI